MPISDWVFQYGRRLMRKAPMISTNPFVVCFLAWTIQARSAKSMPIPVDRPISSLRVSFEARNRAQTFLRQGLSSTNLLEHKQEEMAEQCCDQPGQ